MKATYDRALAQQREGERGIGIERGKEGRRERDTAKQVV